MSIKIALAGNPNCGKTTLFNALTGSNQFVGNWPGVTVEKKEGKLKGHKDVTIMDLPGIYSLSPYLAVSAVLSLLLAGSEATVKVVDTAGDVCQDDWNLAKNNGFEVAIPRGTFEACSVREPVIIYFHSRGL